LGRGIAEFKRATHELRRTVEDEVELEEQRADDDSRRTRDETTQQDAEARNGTSSR